MTPALSILCAVLVAAIVLVVRRARKRIAELNQEVIVALKDSKKAWHLVHDASALLHDTAARGKDARWIPWSERRAAWVKKCEVRG